MQAVYAKLNACKIKAAVLSFIDPYADQFIDKSRSLPIIPDLFETGNVDLAYPELLRKCVEVTLDISDEHVNKVELNTRDQGSESGFFRHRAGRIGASESHAAFHINIAQHSQSLIKTICYPSLHIVNTKATRHGQRHEGDAVNAYEAAVKTGHVNLTVKKCGLFINKEHEFVHATPDFLVSCDCCGTGCGEVKCPITIKDGNFENFSQQKNSCLEKVNGHLQLGLNRMPNNYRTTWKCSECNKVATVHSAATLTKYCSSSDSSSGKGESDISIINSLMAAVTSLVHWET